MIEPRCGQIWFVEGGGDYLSKGRPAVVLHNDAFRSIGSVTVCLLTSNPDSTVDPLLRVPIHPTFDNGLDRPSWLMVDKIQTVRRSRLRQLLGQAEQNAIDDALSRAMPFLSCHAEILPIRQRLLRLLRLGG